MDENTDKKFMSNENQIYDFICNYEFYINNEKTFKKLENKEEINLLLKVLNDHCTEENIKNAIISGFVKEITGLDNSNLFSKAYESFSENNENRYKNLMKFFLNNEKLLETVVDEELQNGLCYVARGGDIDFFEEYFENKNIKQKIAEEKIKLSSIVDTTYIQAFKSYNFNNKSKEEQDEEVKNISIEKKKLAEIIFRNNDFFDLLSKEVLMRTLLNSILYDDIETFRSFFINNDKKKTLIEKILEQSKVEEILPIFDRAIQVKNKEYFEKVLSYDKLRLSSGNFTNGNIHAVTNCFIKVCKPSNDHERSDINKNAISNIFQYRDAEELICKDFLLLCERPFSEYAIEYLINDNELLGKILESNKDAIEKSNNNVIEKAFVNSWANNEDPKVAKVLFDNEKTRGKIGSQVIESCFKTACMNNNIKKANLLIDEINFNIINEYFKLACESENLKVVRLLASKIYDNVKKQIFSDKFFTKNSKLSKQDLELSSILIKNIINKQLLEIKNDDYETFKYNTDKLIENLFEKNDKDRGNKIDKIKNDIKKIKKEKNKNNSWGNKTNFEKILSIFYKIEENLVNFDNEKQQGSLTVK